MSTQGAYNLPDRSDIVIIGAGVSGLYCAWRILEKYPDKKVVVLDRLNRTGGRLDTDLIRIKDSEGTDIVRDEEGGMRFNYGMKELMALCGRLELCDDIVPFPMAPTAGSNNNRFYMRGERFTANQSSDFPGIWGLIYNLSDDEKGKSPVTIITEVYHKIVAHNGETPPDNPTPEYWQKFRLNFTWDHIPMNEWQLWGLLRHMGYSEECVTMLSHAIGFEGPFFSLANAGEAFQIIEDFPKNPTYFTFKKGFSTLPDTLRKKIKEAGGKIYLGVNVDQIEHAEDGCQDAFSLAVTIAPPEQSSSIFVEDGVTKHIHANKIIMAVASKALTELYSSSKVFNKSSEAEQLSKDLKSVVEMRLLKINLYYENSWWEDEEIVNPPLSYGPSFTDLPINSVYPFYSLRGPKSNKRAAALTIYCDFNNTNFWQGLQNVGPKFDSAIQRQHSNPPQYLFPASVAVVREATKQFSQLFGIDEEHMEKPVMTSFRLWGGESDFGYAYHQWALEADDKAVMHRLAEPVKNIYICNEAYSDMQGWVNGSLRSADHALTKFNIVPLVDEPDNRPCKQNS